MNEGNEIINRVANSGLITIDLETYLPQEEILTFDLKDHLFRGLILKEKDFREALKNTDWEVYRDKYVAVTCSTDAIIPMWAFMLPASYLQPVAKDIFVGTAEEMHKHLFLKNLSALKAEDFADERVIIKGCGDRPVDSSAYAEVTKLLRPVAKSIMYGEACSNVPIFKKK
ncbi:DUF2480 family protein [Paraflavisolibacter sp. H34]|uniref:DUF2480 family protein n=1 Tax=Huijunlia imazamoxiresistens TaxID=3127457 RepID=UPI003018F042